MQAANSEENRVLSRPGLVQPIRFSTTDLMGLFRKYDAELRVLASRLRKVFHNMQREGYGTTFGDVEGECVYVLVRETRPEVVFEISPNAGWSTNYLLAALSANQKGTVHSFELAREFRGKLTEQVIPQNQHPDWDRRRLCVHIGDARTTVPKVGGVIDFLLIDSCHEAWFADWYIRTLFPRVSGLALIQDVAFVDQMEPSSEARHVVAWAREHRLSLSLLGALEIELERVALRRGYAERRGLRSNAVLVALPPPPTEGTSFSWELKEGPEALIGKAEQETQRGRIEEADGLLNEAVALLLREPTRVNRHRTLCRAGDGYTALGEVVEAGRTYQRALGVALQADPQQRRKYMSELVTKFVAERRWALMAQAVVLLVATPAGSRVLVETVRRLAWAAARRGLAWLKGSLGSPGQA